MISQTELKSIEKSVSNKFDKITKKAEAIYSNMEWTERAIDHFGTTEKPHEAGFILYDGQLLDFSGGYKDEKRLDHAEIQQIYTTKEVEKLYKKYKPTGIIHLFQMQSNAIRLNSAQYSGYMYMSIHDTQIITPEQIKTIEYITKYDVTKHILYDVYNKDSRAVKYGEVSSVSELKNKLANYIDESLRNPKESSNQLEYHPSLLKAYGITNKELIEVINNSEEKLQYESMFKFLDFYTRLSDIHYKTSDKEIDFYYNIIRKHMFKVIEIYDDLAKHSIDTEEEKSLQKIIKKAKSLSIPLAETRKEKIIFIDEVVHFEHTHGTILPIIFNISDYGNADYWVRRLLNYLSKN